MHPMISYSYSMKQKNIPIYYSSCYDHFVLLVRNWHITFWIPHHSKKNDGHNFLTMWSCQKETISCIYRSNWESLNQANTLPCLRLLLKCPLYITVSLGITLEEYDRELIKCHWCTPFDLSQAIDSSLLA